MKMINTAPHPLSIPGALLADSAYPLQPGRLLVKPARVDIPAGAVVEIDVAFALRHRHGGGSWPSVAYDLTGGMLQPFGEAALKESRLFVDQHPEIQLRQIEHRDRMVRERPDLYPGVDLNSSMQTEHERVATMLGLRQLATMRELREVETATPTFEVVPAMAVED